MPEKLRPERRGDRGIGVAGTADRPANSSSAGRVAGVVMVMMVMAVMPGDLAEASVTLPPNRRGCGENS